MSITKVTGDWAYFQENAAPGWWAIQNPWNNGTLVNGTNYTQTITVDTTQFPNATVLSWSWPNYANSDNVWAYPELVYGAQAGIWQSPDGHGPTPLQIKNLSALTGSFNLTLGGGTDQYDVLWETDLRSAPYSGQVDEFGIFLHTPSYLQQWLNSLTDTYSYNQAGLSATIYIRSGSKPFIMVEPTQGDMLSGTVDIRSILDFLTAKGVLSGNEYIEGFEMGAEPREGIGSLTINSIGYNWNGNLIGSGATPTPIPTAEITMKSDKEPLVTLDSSYVYSQAIYGASIDITAPGVALIVLGSAHDTMQFLNVSSVSVSGGSASSTVSANAGNNTFTAGIGALTVTGGSGADAYVFHKGDATLTIEDWALAKGDTLTVDASLAGLVTERTDRHGGLNIYFGGNSGSVHLVNVGSLPVSDIHFV